jgi:hypothetical protein
MALDYLSTADPNVGYRRHPQCLPGPKISAVATADGIVIVEGWEHLILASLEGKNPEISMIVGMSGKDGEPRDYSPDEAIRLLRTAPDEAATEQVVHNSPEPNDRVAKWASETTPDAIIDDRLTPGELAALTDVARQVGVPLRAVREMRFVARRFPEETRVNAEWAAFATLSHRDDRFEVMEHLAASVAPLPVTGDLARKWLEAWKLNTEAVIDGQRRTGSPMWWQGASAE